MKNIQTVTTAFILIMTMLLSGCAERGNAPGLDIESVSSNGSTSDTDNSLTDSENSVPESESRDHSESEQQSNTESENDSQSGFEESSDINVDAVPVEFTDEDRELQQVLDEQEKGLETISIWFTDGAPTDDNRNYLTREHIFHIGKDLRKFYPIPDNYVEGDYGLAMPNTYDGLKEFLLEYLSEQYTDILMELYAGRGSMSQNPDGTYEVTLYENGRGHEFVEIDGTLYKQNDNFGGKGLINLYVDCNTAKIISKTDDTIEFTYLSGFIRWGELDHQAELSDVELYAAEAHTGVLKYERGGWRRDWDKN